jgi:LPS-assembly protein
MKLTRLLILFASLMLLSLSIAHGADSDLPDTGDIVIKADSLNHDQSSDIVLAEGNVVMNWQGMVLTSDRASFSRITRMLTASGNVVIKKGDDILRSKSVTMDMNTGRGELENGTVSVQQSNVTLTGSKITRIDDTTLILNDTELTTCNVPDPIWKFGADELKVNLLGYAIGKNIIFYVKDTPVLFIPWMAFPVTPEKKSGLLFPRFGNSRSKGAELDIPGYWVISPSQDVAVDLDMLTKRGIGLGEDYRYLRKRGSEGNITGYLIYDLHAERWRGQLAQAHKEIISPDLNLRSVINLTSDRTFLSDYGEKSGDYNRQSNDTVINVLKTWQNYALTATIRYAEDLYAPDNSRTLQTLPDISLAAVRQQLFSTPLYFDLDASAANLYRDSGPSGQRLLLFPRLTLVSGLPGYLHASVSAGAHLRAYNTDNIPDGNGTDRNDAKLLPELSMNVSSSLSRVYDVGGEHLKKVRHELIPELSYLYAPDQDQSRLPSYDYNDRLIHQNVVYYGVTSLLGGKFENGGVSEYRDISRIKLMQGYSIEGTRRNLLTLVNDDHALTDVMLESDTWLHPQVRLTFDARYDVHDNRFSSATPGVEFDDKRGSTAAVSYRMSRNEALPANSVEYLEARLSTKLFKPWTFGYTTRYSFDRPGFLESVYSVEYRHQCWSVILAVHDRVGNPSFSFNFNLAGLTTASTKPSP